MVLTLKNHPDIQWKWFLKKKGRQEAISNQLPLRNHIISQTMEISGRIQQYFWRIRCLLTTETFDDLQKGTNNRKQHESFHVAFYYLSLSAAHRTDLWWISNLSFSNILYLINLRNSNLYIAGVTIRSGTHTK